MVKENKLELKATKNRVLGFEVIENECIWMKAGVVNFRLCDNAYDCSSCPFDKGMRKALSAPENENVTKVSWGQNLRNQQRGKPLPCRHALTARTVPSKICPYNYECYHCPYDQWLDEYDQVEYSLLNGELYPGGKKRDVNLCSISCAGFHAPHANRKSSTWSS